MPWGEGFSPILGWGIAGAALAVLVLTAVHRAHLAAVTATPAGPVDGDAGRSDPVTAR